MIRILKRIGEFLPKLQIFFTLWHNCLATEDLDQKKSQILHYILRLIKNSKAILFLKSISERGGSDILQLWIWASNVFLVDLEIRNSISESLYVGSASFRHWFQK